MFDFWATFTEAERLWRNNDAEGLKKLANRVGGDLVEALVSHKVKPFPDRRVITAPDPLVNSDPGVFLAGGITGCPDWQSKAIDLIGGAMTLYNPRRADFDVNDPDAAPEQIKWEHRALRAATGILFWFPPETIQPIALYELGAWSMTSKPLFVGAHPDYPRLLDVVEQTRLARPDVSIHDTLEATVRHLLMWWRG